jgi:hypothetical protein
MADSVKKPAHYFRYKIEPITFIMQNDVPYAEANAIKYLMRWRYKHPDKEGQIQDLLKAKQYIDLLIEKETHEDVMQLRFRFGDKDE